MSPWIRPTRDGDLAGFALIPVWLAHRLLRLKDLQWPIGTPFLLAYFVLCAASLLLGIEPGSRIYNLCTFRHLHHRSFRYRRFGQRI